MIVARNVWNLSSQLNQKRLCYNVHWTKHSTAIGWKKWVLSKAEYFSTLRTVASSAAILGWSIDVRVSQEQTTVSSHVSGLPSFRGIMVRPSGHLLSDQVNPWASTGRLAEPKAQQPKSFKVWCLAVLPAALLQMKRCPISINQGSTLLLMGTQLRPSHRQTLIVVYVEATKSFGIAKTHVSAVLWRGCQKRSLMKWRAQSSLNNSTVSKNTRLSQKGCLDGSVYGSGTAPKALRQAVK